MARPLGLGSVFVSFDLYFLSLRPGETWADAMARLEEFAAEQAPLNEADLARWDSVFSAGGSAARCENLPGWRAPGTER